MTIPQSSFKHVSLAASLVTALRGCGEALKREQNVRIQGIVTVVVLVAGWLLQLSASRLLFIIAIALVVIGFELLNSALEALADALAPQFHEGVGYAKDVMAAAVLAVSVAAALLGLYLFLPAITALLS